MWAVIAWLVPIWICIAIGILAFYRHERANIAQSTISIASALLSAVDRDLAVTTAAAQVLATSPYLAAGDFAAFYHQASELLPQLGGGNIVLADAAGQQVVNTLVPYGEKLPSPNLANQHKVIETGRPSISDVFIGPVTKKPLMAVGVPVFRGDKATYTLSISVFPQRLSALLIRQGLSPNWVAVVFDGSGSIVARTRDFDRLVGHKGSPELLAAMARAATGVVESVTDEGIPVFATFSRSEVSNWAVVIGVPIAELSGQLHAFLLLGGAGALTLMAVSIALVGHQAAGIGRAVQDLIPPALALGRGEVPRIPRLQVREADDVAQALDRAFHLLQSRTAERNRAQQEKQEAETARGQSERRIEEAQKEGDRRLRNITDNISEGLISLSMQGRLLHWNKAARAMFGFSTEDERLYALSEFADTFELRTLDGRLLKPEEWPLARVIAGEHVRKLELRIRRFAIDRQLALSFSGAIIGDDGGESVAFLSFADISERKQVEEELHRAHADLESRVRERTSELEGFAYAASHDLKAPLRVIDNASKWLKEDLQVHLTGENRENMNLLRGRVGRMEKLLDDLLEYSRIGRATDERYVETIPGDALMDNILGLLSPPAGFTVKVSPDFSSIFVCRMPLQQILMNLVSNAIKHHDKEQGCIEVTVEDRGTAYAFAVKDDGPGIPAQFHDQVFKMFQTLKPRDHVEGSGMGLAMVRKNVAFFGGTLTLESSEGNGSTFRFTWPKQQTIEREAA